MIRTRPPRVVVRDGQTLVEPSIRTAVERLDGRNGRVAGYHLGFLDADGAAVDRSRGKGVRGALALLSARAANADAALGVPAAVACELVHESSLLHDDIIDSDPSGDRARRPGRCSASRPRSWPATRCSPWRSRAWPDLARRSTAESGQRRRIPTGWPFPIRGPSAGAPCPSGDRPRARRYVRRSSVGAPGPIRGPRTAPCPPGDRRPVAPAGQAADLAFESRPTVGVDEARAMVADKTGALLSCAASLGAVLVGGPEPAERRPARLRAPSGGGVPTGRRPARDLGRADRTGKPARSDLRSRKKSFPVVAALASESDAGQRLSRSTAPMAR